jgi:beta-barrel assembly-enhancing protease
MFKRYLRNVRLILVIPVTFILFSACEDSVNPLDFNAFGLADDVKLGRELDQQILANPQEYPILNNAAAQKYVEDIFFEILSTPGIKYMSNFPYQIRIIRRDDIINAFAAPGGYIYVYTGLMKYLDNEATLAAIIAHEIGHCENRHATKRITKAYGVQIILDILLGDNSDQLTKLGTDILTNLAFLKNSRDDEYEADESSFYYLLDTRWYPGSALYFFDKVKKETNGGLLETLLSTHPLPQDRIDAMQKLVTDSKLPSPTENNLFSERYKTFKASL